MRIKVSIILSKFPTLLLRYFVTKYLEDYKALDREVIDEETIKALSNMLLLEETPLGIVKMYYSHDNESFIYWSERQVPYKVLESVSRKYVIDNDCKSIHYDMEEEIAMKKKELLEATQEEEEEEEPSDSVFVTFKKTKSAPGKKPILCDNANRYSYRGKYQAVPGTSAAGTSAAGTSAAGTSGPQERQYIFTNENDEMEIISDNEVNDYVNTLLNKLKTAQSVAPAPLVHPDFETCFTSFKNEIKNELKQLSGNNMMQLDVNGELLGPEQVRDFITHQQTIIQQLTDMCPPIQFNDNQGNRTVLTQEIFDAIARIANNNFTNYHDKDDVLNEHKVAHGNSSSNINFNVEKEDDVCDMDVDDSDDGPEPCAEEGSDTEHSAEDGSVEGTEECADDS